MLPKTMKALVAQSAHKYELATVPVKQPQGKEILLKVESCGICAGDIKASHGTARFWGGDGLPGFCKPPFIPGHEFVGRIVAVGDAVKSVKIGDRVALRWSRHSQIQNIIKENVIKMLTNLLTNRSNVNISVGFCKLFVKFVNNL